jgi:DNA-binding GntR family transcriptional regulator
MQDVEEVFALREVLEVLALQAAWKKIRDEEIIEVEQFLLSLSSDSSADDFYKGDRMVHDLIVRNGNNRRLETFLNTINAQIERLRIISSLTPQRLEKSKAEHLEIINALKIGDYARAERSLRIHINNVKENSTEICRSTWFYRSTWHNR